MINMQEKKTPLPEKCKEHLFSLDIPNEYQYYTKKAIKTNP